MEEWRMTLLFAMLGGALGLLYYIEQLLRGVRDTANKNNEIASNILKELEKLNKFKGIQ